MLLGLYVLSGCTRGRVCRGSCSGHGLCAGSAATVGPGISPALVPLRTSPYIKNKIKQTIKTASLPLPRLAFSTVGMVLCRQGLEWPSPARRCGHSQRLSCTPDRRTNKRSWVSCSVKSTHHYFPLQSCLHPIMDHIVPSPQRRLNCGISITPQEMFYVQQAAQTGEKASTPCSPGLQLPGLKRFVHFKKCPLCVCNSAVLTHRSALNRWNISTPHSALDHGQGARGAGAAGSWGSTRDCPKCCLSITNTNVPAGSCSELNHLQGSLIAVLSSFQLQSHKSSPTLRFTEGALEEAREELKIIGTPLFHYTQTAPKSAKAITDPTA